MVDLEADDEAINLSSSSDTDEHLQHQPKRARSAEYSLYDPEIATQEHTNEDDKYYFCCGNLSSLSIDNFLKQHKCNKFCKMMINSRLSRVNQVITI